MEIPFALGKTITQGFNGLLQQCQKYYMAGDRFVKWRYVFKISGEVPSVIFVHHNAQDMGRYSIICQENRLVPMVEPEVLWDGSHDITRYDVITKTMLVIVFKVLSDYHILLEVTIIRVNLVMSSVDGPKCLVNDITDYTI
eukprot:Gb_19777 [translate_table: standard]